MELGLELELELELLRRLKPEHSLVEQVVLEGRPLHF